MHGKQQVAFLSYPYVPNIFGFLAHFRNIVQRFENPDAINLEPFYNEIFSNCRKKYFKARWPKYSIQN
jgi:hypothetical protein